MQFKFLLVALFFAVIVNAQQTGGSDGDGSITGKANSVLSSLTGKHSKTKSATGASSSATQTSATEPTSSMTSAMSESSSMETTSASETGTGTGTGTTSAATATSTSGAGNTIPYGLPTEMVALVALFMASFIVIVT